MSDNDLDAYLNPAPKRRRSLRDIASSIEVPSDIADDFAKVINFESGASHYDRRGRVKLSPPDPKTGERAVGISQIKPSTARGVGVNDPFDEEQNLTAGLKYFASGGPDPAGRRIHYFGGPRPLQRYQRTGRIPKGQDVLGTTFEKYVRQTGGQQAQRPASDLDSYLDPPSGQIPPSSQNETTRPSVPPLSPDQSVPNDKQILANLNRSFQQGVRQVKRRARQQPAPPPTTVTGSSNLGELRRLEGEDSRQRQQLVTEARNELRSRRGPYGSPTLTGALHVAADPVGSLASLFKSDDQIVDEMVNERQRQQSLAREPEVIAARKEYGRMSAPARTVIAPIERGGASILHLASGLSSLGGYLPKGYIPPADKLSEWAKRRAEITEAGASGALSEDEQEIQRGLPEKVATGVADLGVGLASIIALKKATKLPFNQLLALEGALRASDKPLDQQVGAAVQGYTLGTALERIPGRLANAAISGAPAAARTGYEVSQGRMSPVDAVIQTGIETGAGALLASPRRGQREVKSELQVEAQPDVTAQSETPQPTTRGGAPVETGKPRDESVSEFLQPQPTATPTVATERIDGSDVQRGVGPQRFYHKDFGEVEILSDQTGAGKNKYRIAEVANPERQHFVKKSDLRGRGNERMVPIKPDPAAEDLQSGPVEPARQTPPNTAAEEIVRHNSQQLTGDQFQKALQLESVGGNAGPMRAAVNMHVDRDGRIVDISNEPTPTVEARLNVRGLREVAAIVKYEEGLTNPKIEKFIGDPEARGAVERAVPYPIDPGEAPRSLGTAKPVKNITGNWRVDRTPDNQWELFIKGQKVGTFPTFADAHARREELMAEPAPVAQPTRAEAAPPTPEPSVAKAEAPQVKPKPSESVEEMRAQATALLEEKKELQRQIPALEKFLTTNPPPDVRATVEANLEKHRARQIPLQDEIGLLSMRIRMAESPVPASAEQSSVPDQPRLPVREQEPARKSDLEQYLDQPTRPVPETVPERPETIDLQFRALREGRRDAVLVPPGTRRPKSPPRELEQFATPVGTFYFDPKKLTKAQVLKKVNDGTYGELLGHVAEKPVIGEPTAVITAREGGVEVQSSAVPPERAPEQVTATRQQNPRAEIQVGGPEVAEQVIAERLTPGSTTAAKKPVDRAGLDPPEPPLVAAQRSQVDINRAARGAEPLSRDVQSKSDKALVEEATKANREDPTRPLRLANEVVERPRALTDRETVQLDLESTRLSNELNRLAKTLDNETDDGIIRQRAVEMDAIERDLDILDRAYGLSGTEKGRGLRAQRIAFQDDYSYAGLIRRAISKKGRKLTAEERQRYEKQAARITELESQLAAAESRALDKEVQRAINRERRSGQRAKSKESLDAEYDQLKSQLAQIKSQATEGFFRSERGEIDPEAAKIVAKMARNRIRAGITDAAQLVDDVFSTVREFQPAATKRDVRDAISGYGLTAHPSREADAVRLREIKQLLRDMSAIEDIQSGEAPLRSGLQRDKPSAEIRESQRRVREELRKHPEIERAMRDPVEQQKTLLEAAKTRVRNRIEDLNRLIASGKREERTPSKTVPDTELRLLKNERDGLQELYDQLPDPSADQTVIDRALATTERSVAELERRLTSGDLSATSPSKSPWSEQLGRAKLRQADLRQRLAEARKTAKRGTAEEQHVRQIERELTKTEKEITELQARVASGDVSTPVREGAQAAWSEELGRAKRERAALRQQIREMRAATPESHQREARRKLEVANKSIADLERKIQQGDIATQARPAPETPELAAARQQQKALHSILNDLRQAAKPKPSPVEVEARKRLATERAVQKRLRKQAEELQRKLDERDFALSPKRERPRYSRETLELQREIDDIKIKYNRELYRATRGRGGMISDELTKAANVPKTLKSIGDISAVFRQGGYYSLTHPIQGFLKPSREMLRSFTDLGWRNVEAQIKADGDFQRLRDAGVEFTGVDKADPRLGRREEGFLGGEYLDYVPIAKQIKDFSERTFVSFLDAQRLYVGKQILRGMTEAQRNNPAEIKAVARLINIGTGRGSLGRHGNQYAPALNIAMFSPRLLASRVQLLNNMINPVTIARMPPGARKAMIADNVKFLGATMAILGLAKAAGADVSLDPDDSEFLKIRVGNTVYDQLTGLQQPLRYIINMARALSPIDSERLQTGKYYAGRDPAEISKQFARSKLNPALAPIANRIAGEDFEGRKFSYAREARDLVVPLPAQDVIEGFQKGGLLGAVKTTPTFVGIGTGSYPPAPDKPKTLAEKMARKFVREKMPDRAREDEEIDLDRNVADLRARVRRGDQVAPEVFKLINEGKVTPKRGARVLQAAGRTRLYEDVSGLSAADALRVFESMSADEKRDTKVLILGKLGRFQGTAEEQRKLIDKAQKLGVFAR